ncbi:O-acetyl-ADP-ribose deacetylase [Companilactobacillus alimentarius]|uniref:macro domain-containing protein n=1 Tax=Companilactobacillus alimentarius TaxID=1602 RepID=UPI0028B2A75C|nr:macro domain-containing protein [Companilactobacillus alimentarius]MDT6952210.1 macro domain-containing protein [Companilactobacillus alimentarius]
MSKVTIIRADIADLPFRVDAIVNAANSALIPGGGVDGALNARAGANLKKDMLAFHGTPTGTAVFTKAYNLKTDYVIHAVGPRYIDGHSGEEALLTSAYKSIMLWAKRLKLWTIAVPFLSTGVYGYPLYEAIWIAIETIKKADVDTEAFLVAYDSRTEDIAKSILEQN